VRYCFCCGAADLASCSSLFRKISRLNIRSLRGCSYGTCISVFNNNNKNNNNMDPPTQHETKKRKKEDINSSSSVTNTEEKDERKKSSSSTMKAASTKHHVEHAPFMGPASLLLGVPSEVSRHILSFTILADRCHLALMSKATLELVETFDSMAITDFKKKHGVGSAVMKSARKCILRRARDFRSPKCRWYDPDADGDSDQDSEEYIMAECPWRCLTYALSTAVLYKWNLHANIEVFSGHRQTIQWHFWIHVVTIAFSVFMI